MPILFLLFAGFDFEKAFFTVEAAGVAAQAAVFTNDTMAGDDDAEGISAGGGSRRPRGFGRASAPGQFGVGDGFAERDAGNLFPDFALKFGPVESEGDRKIRALAGQIFI
jgi:hypothetical protein